MRLPDPSGSPDTARAGTPAASVRRSCVLTRVPQRLATSRGCAANGISTTSSPREDWSTRQGADRQQVPANPADDDPLTHSDTAGCGQAGYNSVDSAAGIGAARTIPRRHVTPAGRVQHTRQRRRRRPENGRRPAPSGRREADAGRGVRSRGGRHDRASLGVGAGRRWRCGVQPARVGTHPMRLTQASRSGVVQAWAGRRAGVGQSATSQLEYRAPLAPAWQRS